MTNFKYFICLMLLFVGASAFAQNDAGISELMKQRAQQKVAQMNDNISFMADKSKDLNTRNYYRGKALNLFIEKGEPFEEEGIHNTGVKMETTSIYRRKPSRRLMKDYFTGLVNLRYSKVDIQSTKVHEIEISDLQKIDDDKYVCTAYFEQIFVGYRDGIPIYKDRTRKKVKIYILAEETIDGQEFIVLLGDVTALETSRI
ncbi:hypothetical protein [Phocaeicola sp.]|uniref:hypothetical protein n=1 Tax=Phocaeicola sp. TaxID=2773926 RepID=UPI00284D3F16|nr:hypothetical protein [Phocaeicola sp.]MDR3796030.1 hypothetical protein [Phocaeicola sp.]